MPPQTVILSDAAASGNLLPVCSIGAERVRRHRQRRRDGLRCVPLDIRDGEIKALIARGYLARDAADNVGAIGQALGFLLDRVL